MKQCEYCKEGHVEIDTDSFVSTIELQTDNCVEISTEVKGYCSKCSAEHTMSIQGYADIIVKPESL